MHMSESFGLNSHELLKFKSTIAFSSEGCLNYSCKKDLNEVFITLSIPYEILLRWRQIKVVKKVPCHTSSCCIIRKVHQLAT